MFCVLLKEKPTHSDDFNCRMCQKLCIISCFALSFKLCIQLPTRELGLDLPRYLIFNCLKMNYSSSCTPLPVSKVMQECPPHACSSSAIMFSVMIFWLSHPLSVLPACSHNTLVTSFIELLLCALFSIRLCTL